MDFPGSPFTDHAERHALRSPSGSWKMHEAPSDCPDIPSADQRRSWHSAMRSYRKSGRNPYTLKYNSFLEPYGVMKLRRQILSRIPRMFTHFAKFLSWFILRTIYFNSDLGQLIPSSEWTSSVRRSVECRPHYLAVASTIKPGRWLPRCCRGVRKLAGRKNISKRSNYTYGRILARKTHPHAYTACTNTHPARA